MPRLPSRPRVALHVPARIVLGEPFVATVVLQSAAPTPIDFVYLTVKRDCLGLPPLKQVFRLRTDGTLAEGEHRLSARVTLPAEGPPSYSGRGFVRYVARVHVSIPWWPDRRSDFLLMVTPPSWPTRTPKPLLFSPHPDGASAGVPSYECTLTDNLLIPGGTLAGVVALSNRENVDYRSASISLVGREVPPNGSFPVEAFRIRYELPIAAEKSQLRFRLQLPDELYPTWRGQGFKLNWMVEVCANAKRGKTAAGLVPVEVAPRGTQVAKVAVNALPSIGDARVERVWQEVAAAQGLVLDGDRLTFHGGDVSLVIHRQDGTHTRLVARLTFPSLRLHLDGGRKEGFRRFLSTGIDISDLPWARQSYISGRNVEQARHVATVLAAACFEAEASKAQRRFERSIRLDDLSDVSLVLSVANAGTTATPLSRFASAAKRVLEAAAGLPTSTPPPAGFRDELERWEKVARALGEPLQTTHIGVAGRRAGLQASVHTRWTVDGTCLDAEVSVQPSSPIDERRCFSYDADATPDSLPDTLGPNIHALLATLSTESHGTSATTEGVSARVEAHEPEQALKVLDHLIALATMLRSGDGPFR